jgi:predicted phosphate transport protein (TIGR00153 family)
MFSFFLPKEIGFFDLFDKHASLIVQSIDVFLSIWTMDQSIESAVAKIDLLEQEADLITHQTVEFLHKTFITPIDRDEIFRLISRMDDVIDNIKAAADCLIIYKITSILPPAKGLVKILADSVRELQVAVKGLRRMDNEASIHKTYANINRLKNESDLILRNALGRLFEEESDTRTLIKWKEIYEHLEKAIDRCEDASNIIEGVILEYM